MQRVRTPIAGISAVNRSRVTNGTTLLAGVDGRSHQARRFRDLVQAYGQEFSVASELDRGLIRQAAMLALKSEQLQAAIVRGEDVDADTITKLAGQQRRALADLRRRATATAPAPISILDHLAASADDDEGAD
jgi:hypothetical protein